MTDKGVEIKMSERLRTDLVRLTAAVLTIAGINSIKPAAAQSTEGLQQPDNNITSTFTPLKTLNSEADKVTATPLELNPVSEDQRFIVGSGLYAAINKTINKNSNLIGDVIMRDFMHNRDHLYTMEGETSDGYKIIGLQQKDGTFVAIKIPNQSGFTYDVRPAEENDKQVVALVSKKRGDQETPIGVFTKIQINGENKTVKITSPEGPLAIDPENPQFQTIDTSNLSNNTNNQKLVTGVSIDTGSNPDSDPSQEKSFNLTGIEISDLNPGGKPMFTRVENNQNNILNDNRFTSIKESITKALSATSQFVKDNSNSDPNLNKIGSNITIVVQGKIDKTNSNVITPTPPQQGERVSVLVSANGAGFFVNKDGKVYQYYNDDIINALNKNKIVPDNVYLFVNSDGVVLADITNGKEYVQGVPNAQIGKMEFKSFSDNSNNSLSETKTNLYPDADIKSPNVVFGHNPQEIFGKVTKFNERGPLNNAFETVGVKFLTIPSLFVTYDKARKTATAKAIDGWEYDKQKKIIYGDCEGKRVVFWTEGTGWTKPEAKYQGKYFPVYLYTDDKMMNFADLKNTEKLFPGLDLTSPNQHHNTLLDLSFNDFSKDASNKYLQDDAAHLTDQRGGNDQSEISKILPIKNGGDQIHNLAIALASAYTGFSTEEVIAKLNSSAPDFNIVIDQGQVWNVKAGIGIKFDRTYPEKQLQAQYGSGIGSSQLYDPTQIGPDGQLILNKGSFFEIYDFVANGSIAEHVKFLPNLKGFKPGTSYSIVYDKTNDGIYHEPLSIAWSDEQIQKSGSYPNIGSDAYEPDWLTAFRPKTN